MIGGSLLAFTMVVALFAPVIAPAKPNQTNFRAALEPPSATAMFGRDELGRDILSRVIFGTRLSLLIAGATTLTAAVVGTLLGLCAAVFGGVTSSVIMRTTDLMLAFPSFVVAMAIVGILGAGLGNAIIAIAILFTPRFVRVARGAARSVVGLEYIEASRALGMRKLRIMFLHVAPNSVAPVIALGAVVAGEAVLTAAGLGFLGLGAQPPTAEWGAMLSEGRVYLATAPHVTAFPGIATLIMVLGFNLVGDGLRDFYDVRV